MTSPYTITPIMQDLSADMETPISLYLKLVGDQPGFMLESAESGKNFGRYSFIGFDPFAEIICHKEFGEIITASGTERIAGLPLEIIQNYLSACTVPEIADGPPFLGGGVGYFAYDAVTTMERVRGYRLPEDAELARLLFCRFLVIVDHLEHKLKVVYLADSSQYATAAECEQEGRKKIATVAARITGDQAIVPDDSPYTKGQQAFSPPGSDSTAGKRYQDMVAKAKEYIAAGDAFQIVLSQAFTASLPVHPFNLYRRLRQVNPSPYMFYLNFGTKKLVGASPEMLVKAEHGKVYTCPIAGTRPRGKSRAEDEALAADLMADEKERAEHAMLVDLGRNDIGRVSQPGTVQVERYMEVENFSHVMHIVSLVSGKLQPDYTALDALKACFPAGTVSGAPKARAMEIIHELEGDCRGFYAGAVGYFDFRGSMDTCITIRTMAIDGDEVTIRTGAGIVYDSVPEKEYQEVLHKGRALFRVLEA